MKELARHLFAELYNCDCDILNDVGVVEKLLLEAAETAGCTVVGHTFHEFSPQGVSGVVLVAESHISIHTWPECGYAAVDIFTSGESTDNHAAVETIRLGLKAGIVVPVEMMRGFPDQK